MAGQRGGQKLRVGRRLAAGMISVGMVSAGAAIAQMPVPEITPMPAPQSELLTTQPAGVRSAADPAFLGTSPYSAEHLSSVSESFQVKPKKAENSIIPSGLMPSDAANAETRSRSVNPIDFFQVPPLESGVKLNINP